MTDNSQWVVGDDNNASSAATTTTDQVAKPDVSSTAKTTGNILWILLLGFVLGIIATIGVQFAWKKWGKYVRFN